jgi:crotonobetainyl-CoA:carnitine CoA-transferase CaiB-like acyl-CoA transferase
VANDGLWRSFCALAGLQDWVDRPGFATNAERVQNRAETVALVRTVLARRTRDEWLPLLAAAGIPSSPLHTLGELSAHPHTQASGMVQQLHDEQLGDWLTVSQPLRFDGQRPSPRSPPPSHGADAKHVLQAAGMTDEEVVRLIASGVVRI